MTDKKTQELLDLLDETIQFEEQTEYEGDGEEYRQSQIRAFNFKEIKGIVISSPIILKALEEANKNIDNFIKYKPQPANEELVEFLDEEMSTHKYHLLHSHIGKYHERAMSILPEIKQRLEQQEQQARELVKKIMDILSKCEAYIPMATTHRKVEKEIRQLLSARQPEIKVTWEQFEKAMTRFVKHWDILEMQDWLESLGVKLIKKQDEAKTIEAINCKAGEEGSGNEISHRTIQTNFNCKKCVILFELYERTPKSNRDYWLMTELFVFLHNGDICPAC